tara:strand:- start:542 stop:760 length:219 start_codon:yes stop_codon:yes gene_type:complete
MLGACSTKKITQPHLHNYPYMDDCPSIESRSIDNKEKLKAQAKALGMRYVDYLHFLSNNLNSDRVHIKIVRD